MSKKLSAVGLHVKVIPMNKKYIVPINQALGFCRKATGDFYVFTDDRAIEQFGRDITKQLCEFFESKGIKKPRKNPSLLKKPTGVLSVTNIFVTFRNGKFVFYECFIFNNRTSK